METLQRDQDGLLVGSVQLTSTWDDEAISKLPPVLAQLLTFIKPKIPLPQSYSKFPGFLRNAQDLYESVSNEIETFKEQDDWESLIPDGMTIPRLSCEQQNVQSNYVFFCLLYEKVPDEKKKELRKQFKSYIETQFTFLLSNSSTTPSEFFIKPFLPLMNKIVPITICLINAICVIIDDKAFTDVVFKTLKKQFQPVLEKCLHLEFPSKLFFGTNYDAGFNELTLEQKIVIHEYFHFVNTEIGIDHAEKKTIQTIFKPLEQYHMYTIYQSFYFFLNYLISHFKTLTYQTEKLRDIHSQCLGLFKNIFSSANFSIALQKAKIETFLNNATEEQKQAIQQQVEQIEELLQQFDRELEQKSVISSFVSSFRRKQSPESCGHFMLLYYTIANNTSKVKEIVQTPEFAELEQNLYIRNVLKMPILSHEKPPEKSKIQKSIEIANRAAEMAATGAGFAATGLKMAKTGASFAATGLKKTAPLARSAASKLGDWAAKPKTIQEPFSRLSISTEPDTIEQTVEQTEESSNPFAVATKKHEKASEKREKKTFAGKKATESVVNEEETKPPVRRSKRIQERNVPTK